ncbi:MAG: GNAT family N-acetyltransferase [Anaerolineae bacterium]|nr:GNAT family N-acetyltransferase [Anaerolineae bacterium]
MSDIRRLISEDFDTLTTIVANAYPTYAVNTPEEKEWLKQRLYKLHEEDPSVTFYGLFRGDELHGGMRFHDFTMNFLGQKLPACGIGTVAVDLLHKKEHVAREMLLYFLRHYRAQGVPLAMLYPFRHDFYKQMGFGYGPKKSQYRVNPSAFPKENSRAHLHVLGEADRRAIQECYTRHVWRTHGMLEKCEYELTRMITDPTHHIVGYREGEKLLGYMVFTFEKGENSFINDIHILEWVYETPQVLSEMLTYLHTQADQIRHIIFESSDETFYFLLSDPRNGAPNLIPSAYHESNTQGVGLTYRVLDVRRMFTLLQGHNFGGQTCRLKLTLDDSFLPENAGSTILHFEQGRVHLSEEPAYEVEVQLDIVEFSSLLTGSVTFKRLIDYGLAHISAHHYIDTLHHLFYVEEKPVCMTAF